MSYEKSAEFVIVDVAFLGSVSVFAQHAVKGELQMLKQGNL